MGKNRIRYKGQDDADLGKKPTLAYIAEIIAVEQVMANPREAAAGLGDGCWYILRVIPGEERIVAAHLTGRRFGVYLPERKEYEPILPGYVFVFSRDINADSSRLRAAPGAIDLLRYAGTEQAAWISFEWIDRFRFIENMERADIAYEFDRERAAIVRKERKRASRRHRRKVRLTTAKSSTFDKVEEQQM